MTHSLAPARAAAARRNGALSRGPKTADGKARSSRNALKHGLRAEKLVLPDEDAAAFAALEAALTEELAPQGALQKILVDRMVRAAWRLERAERVEAELFAFHNWGDDDLALAMIRDGNSTRTFDTILRYRGAAQGELFRCLRTLQALQAEAKGKAKPERPAAAPEPPNEPKPRTNPGKIASVATGRGRGGAAAAPAGLEPQDHDRPNEPKGRANPGRQAGGKRPPDRGKAGMLAAGRD